MYFFVIFYKAALAAEIEAKSSTDAASAAEIKFSAVRVAVSFWSIA
jgi:hypothetical protein